MVFTGDRHNHGAEFACIPQFKLTRYVVQTLLHVVISKFRQEKPELEFAIFKAIVFREKVNVCKRYIQINVIML